MKKLSLLLIVALVLGAGGYGVWHLHASQTRAPAFRTVEVKRGVLTATISATGTLEPEEVIDIGAQVAGMILRFGQDPHDSTRTVDYGTAVEPGTVLAQIDESLYKAQVDQAEANVERAKADLLQMQAKLYQAEQDWNRARKLGRDRGVISALDYDTAESAFLSARSTLAVGEAAIVQAKAALNQAMINLGYCTIKSPVKGVIIDRRVNIGQTVVASLNAPSLFLIAKDLRRMQIWASVNEADIGQIQPGQRVSFGVDAYPAKVFEGTVVQIRLNATMTQNVVTYTVVVATDNSKNKLLPYLTANLQFQVSEKQNALLVPNSALRWLPPVAQVAPDARTAFARSQRSKDPVPGEKKKEEEHSNRGLVWIADGEFVRPIKVQTGLTDGAMTEIVVGDLAEDTAVIVGAAHAGDNGSGTTNPFTSQMFGGKKSQ